MVNNQLGSQGRSFIFLSYSVLGLAIILSLACNRLTEKDAAEAEETLSVNAKPYTRWWWFASEIKQEDIKQQLDWLKDKHFGGVEIAFIYPVNRDPKADRIPWLSR